ncbi:helix-turn-helix transcriptional regulator [Actinocorallia longicatena]|uniref:HTH cro/C1-type domain-containing protein n=1 Tax=Actinocorallia longicatena TaxID=111803 RepID=A0ABP6QPE4_9ACTN
MRGPVAELFEVLMPPRSVRGFRSAELKRLREERGLSLAELGDAVGVQRSQVWHWEDGRTVPSPGRLVELAVALDIDPYALFDADEAEPSLHDLRVRRGLSAKDLAAEADLPYEGLVHRLDLGRGRADVPDDVVAKLAAVLKVTAEQVREACQRSRERRPV